MNLHELRTPQPLRDADFAAIRARVKAEIAQREERPWLAMLLRFAFAASLLVLIVPYVRERTPNVPEASGPPASPPAVVAASRAATPGGETPPAQPPRRRRSVKPPIQQTAASRIEIITADPTVRIIWITPKESS